jgi:hypothetical protein
MIKEKTTATAFQAVLRQAESPQIVAAQSVLALHGANKKLWNLEDAVRDRALTPQTVTRMKRAIDAANLERHAAVAQIDLAIDIAFAPSADLETPGVALNSESVGQMVDRLSVLELKRIAHAGTPRAAGVDARLAHLLRCLDRMLDALRAGRALPQRFDEAKTYSA